LQAEINKLKEKYSAHITTTQPTPQGGGGGKATEEALLQMLLTPKNTTELPQRNECSP
jgi:hypothetical protein